MEIKKILMVCIFLILLPGCVIIPVENKKVNHSESTASSKLNTPTKYPDETSSDDMEIQLSYPSKISFPEIKQADFTITYYPKTIAYCKITTNLGSVSNNQLYLRSQNQFIYFLPNTTAPVELDTVLLQFFNENSELIESIKVLLEYDKESKEYHVLYRTPR